MHVGIGYDISHFYDGPMFPKLFETLRKIRILHQLIIRLIVPLYIGMTSSWKYLFMGQSHLQWHYCPETIGKNMLIERRSDKTLSESFGIFRKVSETVNLVKMTVTSLSVRCSTSSGTLLMTKTFILNNFNNDSGVPIVVGQNQEHHSQSCTSQALVAI